MENRPEVPEDRKPCPTCGSNIPAQATACSHCLAPQDPAKSSLMKTVLGSVGFISAVLGLLATLAGGVRWMANRHQQSAQIKTEIALAQTQSEQAEYEAAVHTWQDIQQRDPHNRQAPDGLLNAVMLWDEYFTVSASAGQETSAVAAPKIDQLFALLDAARARVNTGPQAADVLAHIGWTHWLNRRIAYREFGDAPEKNLRAALAIDPNNVYANAMLGTILIELHEDLTQAAPHFATALATGKQRPLVRKLQLVALLTRTGMPGSCAELVRVSNQMRLSGEPINDEDKHRILSHGFSIYVSLREMAASLSAVPPDQAWATYQWLAQNDHDYAPNTLYSNFIAAKLLEVSGKRVEALAAFRTLQKQLSPDAGASIRAEIDDSVKRLSHPA